MTNNCNTQDYERVPNNSKFVRQEGLGFMQTLNIEKHEKCRTSMGLFEVLSDKFKPQHNETTLPLQY